MGLAGDFDKWLGKHDEAFTVWLYVAVLLLLLVLVLAVLWKNRIGIVAIILNCSILYFLLYRAYFDLKKGRRRWYFIGALLGIVAVFLLPPTALLWPVTFIVLVTFVVVELARLALVNKRRR